MILTLFVSGVLTVVLSLLLLFFDVRIPNPLKGVIFFAQVCKTGFTCNVIDYFILSLFQVIGLIFRNTPYLDMNVSTAVSIAWPANLPLEVMSLHNIKYLLPTSLGPVPSVPREHAWNLHALPSLLVH